ncbi:protein ACCELERATED CELL DEATH 6-like [Typha angustifolia]|uniref:protein ACCELERATED CELL DEATH 6-like n=1 Tax=Typha angustifolia TaxID=59011 RepID=UPI003C2AB999
MNPQTQVDPIGHTRIPIDLELLKAARIGDQNLLLQPPSVERTETAIEVPRRDVNLLGVTVGGNTALHIASTHGHLKLAKLICQRESSLLEARNVMLETPLHCAARAGNDKIVSSIISFTRDSNGIGVETMLRARNRAGETALHEAARNGHVQVAVELMSADPGLANMVDEQGISPLYLAATAGSVALLCAILPSSSTTTTASFPVSCAGPNGQTALHAAAFFFLNLGNGHLISQFSFKKPAAASQIAKELLKWNKMLAKSADKSGSTPLHYAASVGNEKMVKLLLEHDSSLAYISDSSGLFPVHVTATMGRVGVIGVFIKHCPDSDELLDNKGRNLLHNAVEHKRIAIVQYVCKRSDLVKLMNAKDYEGNTPLHLAVRSGEQEIVSLLMRNKRVDSSTMNKDGLTPLDLSVVGVDRGLTYVMNPSDWILMCLQWAGARFSPHRADHFVRDNIVPEDLEKESQKHASLTRSLAISSVVIATVAFAAAFTLPGGYRADGTPTLVRRYTFKAFVIADTFAFIFSVLSTYFSTFGGAELMSLKLRRYYVASSTGLLAMAGRSLVAAFALAIYLVLAPVSNSFGIVVCVIASTSELLLDAPHLIPLYKLAITMKGRVGWTGLFESHALRFVLYLLKSHILEILGASLIYIFIFLLALL